MKIKLLINGKEIDAEIDEKQLENIKEKNSARKRAGYYNQFFSIDVAGGIGSFSDTLDSMTNMLFETGNYFLTEEEAKKEANKRYEYSKALQTIKDYIVENGMSFEPDWEDYNQKKWIPCYSYERKVFFSACNFYQKDVAPFGYLISEKDLEQLVKDCEKELKIIFEIK